ncbi:hypothetical protein [Spirosoma endophyticum]|uniref:Uncharacterized protein n=1 Tax=Spirosoma endophyticum TaxID=662367 RepID=A0A1I1XVX2_9BACT|nr:hypothetical protein [Spirosoma endophyticum]SFE11454.1 hypothetical protein SAMN05216167_110140 [Spirosoma endophyticum]
MKTTIIFIALQGLVISAMAQTPTLPSPDVQIKTAVLAAPADKRDGATVYGYSPKNEFVVLRKGTNELICLTDDPAQKGLSVSCYHRDLDPFMERGRILKKDGKKADEILKTREQEVKDKKLTMPVHPSTLFSYSAKDENYNAATGEVKDGYLRYVVYIPYATAESTGLPLKPEAPGMPWIMDPGTHRAHIMINPPVSTTAH